MKTVFSKLKETFGKMETKNKIFLLILVTFLILVFFYFSLISMMTSILVAFVCLAIVSLLLSLILNKLPKNKFTTSILANFAISFVLCNIIAFTVFNDYSFIASTSVLAVPLVYFRKYFVGIGKEKIQNESLNS